MKRIVIFLFVSIASSLVLNAQIYVDNQGNVYDQRTTQQTNTKQTKTYNSKSSFDKSKLEYGGQLGVQFGNYTTVNVSPEVGYRFSNLFSAGVGIGYTYYNDDSSNNYDYTEHFASFNLYGNIYPTSFLIFSVRPEISRMWQTVSYDRVKDTYSKFVPSVVVGGGVRFGPMTAQIKYDVVQDDYSPYGNSIFYSVGFTF